MLGVVGRVKQTPKFDAQGGRKGKTDPQIWCPGCWIASLHSQWQGAGCWIASLRSQWRGAGCWIASLHSQWQGAGCWIASLRSQWRGAGCWIASLRSQWRGAGCWIATLRSQWREERGAGLPRFARNDGGREIASLKRGGEWRRDSGFLFF